LAVVVGYRSTAMASTSSRRTLVLAGLTMLVVLGGCGSSTPKPDAAVTQLVQQANGTCNQMAQPSTPVRFKKELARDLLETETQIYLAAEYLPAGRAFDEAERALMIPDTLRKIGQEPKPDHPQEVRAYDSLKALGVTSCGLDDVSRYVVLSP
jgi:hypothetical protein